MSYLAAIAGSFRNCSLVNGTSWQQIQNTNTDGVLAISFGNNNRLIEITVTQVE